MRVGDTAEPGEVGGEIAIGFVESYDDVVGDAGEKGVECIRVDYGAGWIIRVREEDETRVFVDGFGDGVEVKGIVAHGHGAELSASGDGDDGIDDEAAFAGDGVEAGGEKSAREKVKQVGGTGR